MLWNKANTFAHENKGNIKRHQWKSSSRDIIEWKGRLFGSEEILDLETFEF